MFKQHQYLNPKLLVKKTTFPFSLLIMKRTFTNSERSENTDESSVLERQQCLFNQQNNIMKGQNDLIQLMLSNKSN